MPITYAHSTMDGQSAIARLPQVLHAVNRVSFPWPWQRGKRGFLFFGAGIHPVAFPGDGSQTEYQHAVMQERLN